MVSVQCVKNKVMDKDIYFTDEQGNEFFVKVRDEEVIVFKNKTQIEDVRFYLDELDGVECQDYENHKWVVSEKDNTGSWSEAECNICGLRKSNS